MTGSINKLIYKLRYVVGVFCVLQCPFFNIIHVYFRFPRSIFIRNRYFEKKNISLQNVFPRVMLSIQGDF